MDIIPGQEYNFTLNPEDPGFGEVIVITKAEHLASNRTFISEVYNEIKGLDNIWSETIPENDYIRITFEIPSRQHKRYNFVSKNNFRKSNN